MNKISALLVVAVVLVFFAGVYVVLNPLTFPSTTAAIVTLNGTVEEVISDCPPSTSRNQTCSFFDVIVLRAVNGSTFLLHNLPSHAAVDWKGGVCDRPPCNAEHQPPCLHPRRLVRYHDRSESKLD